MEEQKNRMTNERDYKQVHGYTAPDKEKEELIKRLGEMITDRYAVKLTHSMQTDDPEYWALDEVLTKEEAKFMLSFGKTRINYTAKELAKKNDMTEEETQKIIDHLVWTGVVELNRENEDHHLQYNVPIFVPGSAEFMMMQGPLTEAHPNLASFFNLMTQMPLEGMTPMVPLGGAGIGMHVIPVEKAIETQNQSVSVEHLSHWLNKYDKYSIGLCTCRKQQEMRGEGDGEVPGDFCIGVGDMAEFCVTRNTGHYASYEEVMELLERAERHGWYLQLRPGCVQCNPYLAALQHAEYVPLGLSCACGSDKMCCLRQVRGGLPCRSSEAWTEAVQKGRNGGHISEDAPSGCSQVDGG